uniref:Uncharacterized protein n=1 Tax=Parastrongyloides trichosuri TaxID=131310 RepID=A0A0N4ZW76_PARTI
MKESLLFLSIILALIIANVFCADLLTLASSSLTQTYNTNCATAETEWLEWSSWGQCTDTCGSCGIHMRTRICLTTNSSCACSGAGTQLDYCNLNVCVYPRQTCCYQKTAQSYQGKFTCLTATSG